MFMGPHHVVVRQVMKRRRQPAQRFTPAGFLLFCAQATGAGGGGA